MSQVTEFWDASRVELFYGNDYNTGPAHKMEAGLMNDQISIEVDQAGSDTDRQ